MEKELIGIVRVKKRNGKVVQHCSKIKEGNNIYFELNDYYQQTGRWFTMKEITKANG